MGIEKNFRRKTLIRAAVVDDDIAVQNTLTQYIKDYEKNNKIKFNITIFSDASQIVNQYKAVYDIIFMDIQMDEMDGLKAAKMIREMDQEVIIIFVTNMADFAIKGYTVDAQSYVVKPIMYVDFVQQLTKAVQRIEYNRNAFILVTVNNEILRLDISKIAYMESSEHKVVVHMETKELTIYSSLKKMEQQVEGYYFVRCNSGYLVSLSHVEGVERDVVIVSGDRLTMSRSKKKKFMNALADYIGGEFK